MRCRKNEILPKPVIPTLLTRTLPRRTGYGSSMAVDLVAVQQAYHDNADYDETGSVAKAKAYRTAIRRLIGNRPEEGTKGGPGSESFRLPNWQALKSELNDVERFIAANDILTVSAGPPVYTSFEEFRS